MGSKAEQELDSPHRWDISAREFFHENADLLSLFGILSGVSAAFPRFLSGSPSAQEAGVSGALLVVVMLSIVLFSDLTGPLGHALYERNWVNFASLTVVIFGLAGISVAVVISLVSYLGFLLPIFDTFLGLTFYALYFLTSDSRFHLSNVRQYERRTRIGFLAQQSHMLGLIVTTIITVFRFRYFAQELPFTDGGLSITAAILTLFLFYAAFTAIFYIVFRLIDTAIYQLKRDTTN